MSMTPASRLDVAVLVRVDAHRHPGFLEHRRRAGDGWEGIVRWKQAPGMTRIG